MKKSIYIILCLLFFTASANAVEEVNYNPYGGFSEMSDYTGENFFRSSVDLDLEKEKKAEQEKLEEERSKFEGSSYSSFSSNKGLTPPLKKMRLKYKEWRKKKIAGTVDGSEIQLPEEETQAVMNCKTMQYYPERNEMEALGGSEIYFPKQETTLKSDKMVYNQDSNVLEAIGNVEITKQGVTSYGDYMKIYLNEETAMLDNLRAEAFNFEVHAEKGYMYGDTIVANHGKITSNKSNIIQMYSTGFGDQVRNLFVKEEDKYLLTRDMGENKFVVKVKDIKIHSKKAHDTVTLKNAVVYRNNKKVVSLPSMTFYTNKGQNYVEGNYPEIGSFGRFGMFAGPGVVLEVPKLGSTLKLIPILNYRNQFGFGGIARYKSATNITDVAYGSAAKMMMVTGRQRLDDNLYAQYGMNSYMDDWFLGRRWVKYGGELVHDKVYTRKDFLAEGMPLRFTNRFSAGYFQEDNKYETYDGYNRDRFDKDRNPLRGTGIGTARFKYMAEAVQTLYSIRDEEKLNIAAFDIVGQGSTAVYGTGDTQFIGRIGPRVTTQYKYWRQELGYFLSGYSDGTPMPLFDSYRYGRSNAYLREYIRLHKLLTLAWYGSVNLSQDSIDGKMFQECSFFASIGPDDLKLNLGYDAVRNTTYFGISVAMDTKGSVVDYERMEIKNPDTLGKTDDEVEEDDNAFEKGTQPINALQKAVVTDIEDDTLIMENEKYEKKRN